MDTKILGRTNLEVTELAFGGIPVMRLSKEEGVELIRSALDLGINFIDTATGYGDSEEKIGEAIRSADRSSLVLASKSPARTKREFLEHLDLSLERLGTDYLDIYYLHNVSTDEAYETVLSPGGALEGLKEAVQSGKVRFPAVSCHNERIALKCIDTGHFDVLQFPLNFVDDGAEAKVLPRVREMNLGFVAMKPLGGGLLEEAELCFRYLQQFDWIVPDPGIERLAELEEILRFYRTKRGLTPDEKEKIGEIKNRLGKSWCHRCDYCQPCPQGIVISMVLIGRSIAKRMPRETAARFLGKIMENAAECTECGECVTKCPYDLPIPDLLKTNRRKWESFMETGEWG